MTLQETPEKNANVPGKNPCSPIGRKNALFLIYERAVIVAVHFWKYYLELLSEAGYGGRISRMHKRMVPDLSIYTPRVSCTDWEMFPKTPLDLDLDQKDWQVIGVNNFQLVLKVPYAQRCA